MCDVTHSWYKLWHGSFICVTCRIHLCDMTHLRAWHDSFMNESCCHTCIRITVQATTGYTNPCDLPHTNLTCLIHMCFMINSHMWRDSFVHFAWLIHTCRMTHSYLWHDSFTCVTWLMRIYDMFHSYMRHDSFICATWPINLCDINHRGRLRGFVCVWVCVCVCACGRIPVVAHKVASFSSSSWFYGVASVSRIDKIVGLFCKRALLKRRYSAKETFNFIDPTDRSHPIFLGGVSPWAEQIQLSPAREFINLTLFGWGPPNV